MGGGLGFLHKKSWHTGGGRMIAKVWQKEQEAAHEERRLEEMKKEIAEERKLQELQMQAAEAGHIDKVERLEFMYKGGPVMSDAERTQEDEAYLLGEKKYQTPAEEHDLARVSAAPGAKLADGQGARNETWNKLNSDPLLMMRMQEQDARKHVMHNPVKMAQIQKEVAELRGKKKAGKEAKKEAKREKKEARKRAIREEVRRKVLGEEGYAVATRRERGKPNSWIGDSENSSQSGSPIHHGRPYSRSRSRSPPHGAGGGGGGGGHERGRERGNQHRGGSGDVDRGVRGAARDREDWGKDRDNYARRLDEEGADGMGGGRRNHSRGHGRSRSGDRDSNRTRVRAAEDSRDRDRRQWGLSRGRGEDDDTRSGGGGLRDYHHVTPASLGPGNSGRGGNNRGAGNSDTGADAGGDKGTGTGGDKGTGVRDGASAQDGAKGYGLTYANPRGEEAAAVRRERRNEWRESTRDEREVGEEEEQKAKEAAWAKTGGKNSVGHRTGKLTAEEKAERLRTMMSDAEVHDNARYSRLKTSAAEEAAGGEKSLVELSVGAPGRHHSDAAPFLEAAQRSAFGGGDTGSGGGGLEDRIGVRKYYAQREAEGNSYKR